MKSITVTRDNWLIQAASLEEGQCLYLYPCGELTQANALAALDAQYGSNIFDAWQHGQALRIIRGVYRDAERYKRISDANEAYWKASKDGLPREEIDALRERWRTLRKEFDQAKRGVQL